MKVAETSTTEEVRDTCLIDCQVLAFSHHCTFRYLHLWTRNYCYVCITHMYFILC